MELAYDRVCEAGYEDVLEAVEHHVGAHGFCIVERRDVRAILRAKGFDIAPLMIYEILPLQAAEAWRQLPSVIARCRIQVSDLRGAVLVSVLRPAVLCAALLDSPIENWVLRLDAEVTALVDDTASSVTSSSWST